MIASELITKEIKPLKTSDTGADAISEMTEYYIKHLPIVNNQQLLGILSEDDILDHELSDPIGTYNLSLNRPYVEEDVHLYEVLKMMSEYKLTAVPVVDFDDNYLGIIDVNSLLHFFAGNYSFREPGSIVVLEMSKPNYSLAHLAQIVESNNAVILSTQISTRPDSVNILVTLKINKQDLSAILQSFERYEYRVKASFSESKFHDDLQDRYDGLMSYLNV